MVIVFRHIAFTRLYYYEHGSKIDRYTAFYKSRSVWEIYRCRFFAYTSYRHTSDTCSACITTSFKPSTYIFFEIIYNNETPDAEWLQTSYIIAKNERTTDTLIVVCGCEYVKRASPRPRTSRTYLAYFLTIFFADISSVCNSFDSYRNFYDLEFSRSE